MPRWLRIIRGMIGTGLTFAAGVGVVASLVAGVAWLLTGGAVGGEMLIMVVGSSVWAFAIGVAFSGVLAITARGLAFERLSIPRFAVLGAGVGLFLFGVLALNAWDAWSIRTAMVNGGIFVVLGAGSAAGTLLLARRAGPALESGGHRPSLEEG